MKLEIITMIVFLSAVYANFVGAAWEDKAIVCAIVLTLASVIKRRKHIF